MEKDSHVVDSFNKHKSTICTSDQLIYLIKEVHILFEIRGKLI